MNKTSDNYLTENKELNIGNESVKYDYATPFAGLIASNQARLTTDEYKGVLPSYNKNDNKV